MSSFKNHENSALKVAQFKSLNGKEKCDDNYVDAIFEKLDVNVQVPSTIYLKNHHSELIGATLLHLAYKEKNMDLFDMLIQKGTDFCKKDSKGNTVVHSAFQYDSTALSSFNWNIVKNYNCTENFLFVVSVMSAHVEHKNINNPSDSNGLTHFHVACAVNNVEAVKFFLKNKVPVDQRVYKAIAGEYFQGYTALHFAAQFGYADVIDMLLESGANAYFEDAKGRTPLCIALERNIWMNDPERKMSRLEQIATNERIMNSLLKHDVSASRLYLYIASSMQTTEKLQNYLTPNSDVNQFVSVDSRHWPGYSALHFAAHVNLDSVKLHMKFGGNIEAKDVTGVSPFDMCVDRYEPEDVIDILMLVPKWKNIVMSDGKTRLKDLLVILKNPKKRQRFLNQPDDKVELFVPNNSPLWPGFTVLHLAVLFAKNSRNVSVESDIVMIKKCLENDANVTAMNLRNWTPIHLGFRLNKRKIVDLMLENHHRMQNCVDDENLSHLHVACALEKDDLVKKLLWNYANVNVVYKGKTSILSVTPGSTPLHIAVRNNNVKIVKFLLRFGADPHVPDARGFTPIHCLTYHLHSRELTKKLLSTVNLRDHVVKDVGLSYLHIACGAANVNAVKTLLDHGANVNGVVKVDGTKDPHLKTYNGNTALHFALSRPDNSDIVTLLLEGGVDILANNSLRKILYSKEYKVYNALVATLFGDSNLEARVAEETGVTMLHVACCSAIIDLIKVSLDLRDDVNAKIRDDFSFRPGCTPLHLLVYDECTEKCEVERAIELLVDDGVDVNLKNVEGFTPLHVAYGKLLRNKDQSSSLTQVNLLLQAHKNFRINPTDDGGISHFHIACYMLNVDVVEKFLKHGVVDVNATIDLFYDTDIAGCSPLLLATRTAKWRNSEFGKKLIKPSAKLRIVELLIKKGARVNVEDIDGNTPAHYAALCNSKDENYLKLLAHAEADVNTMNVRRKTPFELLINRGHLTLDEARYFIKYGCILNGFDQLTEEGYIARALLSHGDMEYLVEETFTNYPDSMKSDDRNRSAIHNLVSVKHCEINEKELADLVDTLIEFGCDIDERDNLGKTALHLAAQFRNVTAVNGLLLAGADINILDHDGKTPFAYLFAPCSCTQTNGSPENHVQYVHREVFEVFMYHIKKMENCRLRVEESNADLLNVALTEFDLDEDPFDMDDFYDEFDQMVDLKIEPYSVTLMHFVYDADVVFDYPRMYENKCDAIKKFFEKNRSDFRDEYRNAAGIFQLQYRQAVQRRRIFGKAEDALTMLAKVRLPNVCSDIVFEFLENFELRNLIESTK